MKDVLFKLANWLTSVATSTPSLPIVLVFHGVPKRVFPGGNSLDARTFEEHVIFIKQVFKVVSVSELQQKRAKQKKPRVILTFDDGFRNNATVAVPILQKHGLPATFFITSRHTLPGQYLWFQYLSVLEHFFKWNKFSFNGDSLDMSPNIRKATVADLRTRLLALRPHAQEMYRVIDEKLPPMTDLLTPDQIEDWCAGMTLEHIEWISHQELFTLGVHTVDHPLLPLCAIEEQELQVQENKKLLEKISGAECNLIAYPCCEYDLAVLNVCNNSGLTTGFAVSPKKLGVPNLEIERIGIYSQSQHVLEFKALWGAYLRKMHLNLS